VPYRYDWYLLVVPVAMGVWGLLWLFNIFGAADSEARFYRGRPYWYPILDGDKRNTHRLMGAVLLLAAIAMVVAYYLIG